ncbi:hypothetical protein FY528_09025 [Hymenobacter lutimineralis]|uniref:Uncharacterized protein n=1 Tax=Hymenobacter lutimineralis TaxID=2606448 RepID=A0A5D6V7E7_9BACT|nr:hypothetical protein [Hymenobacter lutimineralis]TYZ10594.1 hypothetical protein FY528_09025 [Hymenobacter lutimineralis]
MNNPYDDPSGSLPQLPDYITKSHAFLHALMEQCAALPFSADVGHLLRAALSQKMAEGYAESDGFLRRLPEYIEQYLKPKVSQHLLATAGPVSRMWALQRLYSLKPETWPYWDELCGKDELIERRRDVEERLGLAEQENRTQHAESHRANIKRIDTILATYELATAEGRTVLWASEVQGLPEYETPTAALLPKVVEKSTTELVDLWAGLLLNGFRVDEVDACFMRAGLIDGPESKMPGPDSAKQAWVAAWAGIEFLGMVARSSSARLIEAALKARYPECRHTMPKIRALQNGMLMHNATARTAYYRVTGQYPT